MRPSTYSSTSYISFYQPFFKIYSRHILKIALWTCLNIYLVIYNIPLIYIIIFFTNSILISLSRHSFNSSLTKSLTIHLKWSPYIFRYRNYLFSYACHHLKLVINTFVFRYILSSQFNCMLVKIKYHALFLFMCLHILCS